MSPASIPEEGASAASEVRPDVAVSVRRTTAELLTRRMSGQFEVDEFGLDPELIELVDPLAALRYRVDVRGAEHVPAEGPAVIVANRRFGVSEPIVLARGVRRTAGRRVRFMGIPDVAPLGPVLRRLGGAVSHPDEVASMLGMGHVVSIPLGRSHRKGVAGPLAPFALEPALALDAPVIPAAVVGREVGRRWRVTLGAPLPRLQGRGPLAMAELADEAREGVQRLLDEMVPPHWLFG